MSGLLLCSCLLGLFITANADPQLVVAVATLTPRAPGPNIIGMVQFAETENGVQVTGSITGLPPGKYGFHVHVLGDITTCDTSLDHFNPYETNHGGQNHTDRHVGDLGNIEFEPIPVIGGDTGIATVNFVDRVIALRGPDNIVGRTLVLHEQEDDLGMGGHETSLTTGNAGARVACGVIGLRTPWNSAVTSSPSILLFIAASVFVYFRV